MKYEQMEFDFGTAEPCKPEKPEQMEQMEFDFGRVLVEITYGFDGAALESEVLETRDESDVSRWIALHGSGYAGYVEWPWTCTRLGDRTVVDFGSHTRFARYGKAD